MPTRVSMLPREKKEFVHVEYSFGPLRLGLCGFKVRLTASFRRLRRGFWEIKACSVVTYNYYR